MFNSLKKKIIAAITSIIVVCTLVFMIMSIYEAKKAVQNQMMDDGSTLITQINSQLKEYSLKDKDTIRAIFKNVADESKGNITYISIVDPKMNMLVGSDESGSQASGNDSAGGSSSTDAVSSASATEDSSSVSDAIKTEKTSGFIFENHGEKVYNVSMPYYDSANLVGTINIGISLKGMNGIISGGLLETAVAAAVILAIAILASVIISGNLTRPLNSIVDKLDDFAAGDFTLEFTNKSRDETGRLTRGLNNTVTVLRETLQGIKSTVAEMNRVSGELTSSGEVAALSGHTVQAALNEVFQGVSDQNMNISDMAAAFEGFSRTLDHIQVKSEEVVDNSRRIKENADTGSENLGQLINSISDVRNSFGAEEEKIQILSTYMGKIGDITDVINSVAGQTNLLALNAAIEAARAGEAGRGFSVVADEIRKLAEQVMESSKSINSLIQIVRSSSEDVTSHTRGISDKINGQVAILEGTVSSFKDIQEEVNKSLLQMDDTYKLIEGTVKEKDKITNKVEALSGISEELSASAREISAAADEQTSNIDNLSELARALDTVADNLTGSVDKFKI
ncbi:MAG: methyl-accepting chemotaxis protein [Bacillota bacterium]|nr:methyl-accepting chemotaxis protein [Bacillota bacterium]